MLKDLQTPLMGTQTTAENISLIEYSVLFVVPASTSKSSPLPPDLVLTSCIMLEWGELRARIVHLQEGKHHCSIFPTL